MKSHNDFYRAFEDLHRGSRELIMSRQMVYLPFIQPLKMLYAECPVIDLGCGRGEWLEILIRNGFQAQGVDLDDGMLQACFDKNLPAALGDALATLKSLPSESQVVVSGFHIAEHIPFDSLEELVGEALRVLKPAGLLILETPNAENLVVGTNNFYLDPTHERPIPHLLLSFLAEYIGFARFKLLRLQESKALVETEQVRLIDVLSGASPDYAIVAQKAAEYEKVAYFESAFSGEHGLTLGALSQRYDNCQKNKFRGLEERLKDITIIQAELHDALEEVNKKLKMAAELNSHEMGVLAESFTQFGNALLAKMSHTESLEKQFVLANDQMLRLERQCGIVENKLLLSEQRAASSERHSLVLERRAIFAETCVTKQELRADAAEARAVEQSLRADAAEACAAEQSLRADAAEARAVEQSLRANAAEASAEVAEASLQAQRLRIDELDGSAHHWWQQANNWHEQVLALHRSTSWKITKPMRAVKRLAKGDFLPFQSVGAIAALKAKKTFRPIITSGIKLVFQHPELRARLSSILKKYPLIHQRLVRVAINSGKVFGSTHVAESSPPQPCGDLASENLSALTPHARQIYADLKAAIEKKKRYG